MTTSVITRTKLTSRDIILKLYELYSTGDFINGEFIPHDYSYGDPIIVIFGSKNRAEDADLKNARNFAEGLRKQLDDDDATVEQSGSRVIIKPKL